MPSRLAPEQRADGGRLNAAQLGEELALGRRDAEGGGEGSGAVGGRGGQLDVAGEVAGVAVDGAAAGLVAEQGQAGGVAAGAGRARFAAGEELHLLLLLG